MNKKLDSSLWLRFIVYVFVIMCLTFLAIAILAAASIYFKLFPLKIIRIIPLFSTLVISVVISSFFTILIGHRILIPIETLIAATKKVAKGDFNIRLDENYREKQIRDMNFHFNKMIRELNGIETLRNDFVVNVSHEFKTPISAIEGYATLLQDPDLSETDRREYTQMILDSACKLSSLSGNILKLTKFETQEILPEKNNFYLDEQLRQALLSLENKWSKKNINIDMDLPPVPYYGNEEFLMQVWENLFGNAIKFTPENGTISTRIIKSSNDILISISDTGIGMNEDVQKRIFEKFYQGDSNRSHEGNGLGLTLVKRIIDLSEGEIKVQSSLGQGTTFTILLPL